MIVGLIAIFAVTALFVKRYVLLDIFEYISSRVYLKYKTQYSALIQLARERRAIESTKAFLPNPSCIFNFYLVFSIGTCLEIRVLALTLEMVAVRRKRMLKQAQKPQAKQ